MKMSVPISTLTKARILNQIMASIDHALMVFDKNWRLQCWSRPTAKLLGYPEELLQVGTHIRDLIAVYADSGILGPGDPQELIRQKLQELRTRPVFEQEVRLPTGGYSIYRRWPTEDGGFITVAVDITNLKQLEDDLRLRASTDALTGISNRRYFMECAVTELMRCRRQGSSLSLLMLDIDHFKYINDAYGHSAGDEVLRCFVNIVKARIRESDIFGRLGGEEFALILPDTDISSASKIAEELCRNVSGTSIAGYSDSVIAGHDDPIRLTVSIGISSSCAGIRTIEQLLRNADNALYEAKRDGRNRVAVTT